MPDPNLEQALVERMRRVELEYTLLQQRHYGLWGRFSHRSTFGYGFRRLGRVLLAFLGKPPMCGTFRILDALEARIGHLEAGLAQTTTLRDTTKLRGTSHTVKRLSLECHDLACRLAESRMILKIVEYDLQRDQVVQFKSKPCKPSRPSWFHYVPASVGAPVSGFEKYSIKIGVVIAKLICFFLLYLLVFGGFMTCTG